MLSDERDWGRLGLMEYPLFRALQVFVVVYILFGIWRARRIEGATKLGALLEVLKKSAIFLIFFILLLVVILFLVRVTGNADCSVWNETFFGKYFC